MKNLSIKNKVLILVLFGLVLVTGTTFIVNNNIQSETISTIYKDNTDALNWSLTNQIEELMVFGENEKLQPLTENIVSQGISNEVTIVDADLNIARSSNPEIIGEKSTDKIWIQLFAQGRDAVFEEIINDEAVQISYKVFKNEGACTECHDTDTEKILGGLKMVKSKQFIADANDESLAMNLLLFGIGLILLIGSINYILKRQIFTPLNAVTLKLERASEGDIDQVIRARSNDEIGLFLTKIQALIDYIKVFANASEKIANRDLRVVVEPKSDKDILGKSFKQMVSNLTEIIQQLTTNTAELMQVSGNIALTSQKTSSGTVQQAEEVRQIASAVEELSKTTTESSKNANQATSIAGQSSETATAGGKIIDETISSMKEIVEIVRNSSESIGKLESSANKIGEIINVIDDIADQTNLLALNAAIEAARAGEQGRGFAVVADEVRKLAERTAKATSEISDMIKGIQVETNAAVSSMGSGLEAVGKGQEQVDQAGQSLVQIVSMSEQVMSVINSIANSTDEQNIVTDEIAKNMDHITAVAIHTEKGAHEASAAAEELSRQAESMRLMVSKFKLEDNHTGMFSIAKSDHKLYMEKLNAIVEGILKVEDWKAVDHHNCRFGKWYDTVENTSFCNLKEFKELKSVHKDVHLFANRAIEALKANNEKNVQVEFDKAIEASQGVINYCDSLVNIISKGINV